MSPATRRFPRLPLLVVFVALVAVIAAVLTTSLRHRDARPGDANYRRWMISDLHGLGNAEALFFTTTGHYTADPDSTMFLRSVGVDKPSVTLREGGWSATVTDPRAPGLKCGIGVGVRNPVSRSAKSGEVACD